MLITCKNKTVKIHSEISFNTIHSSMSFDVVIDSSIDDRKAFMRQMLKHMNEVRADGFFRIFDSIEARVRAENFFKSKCAEKNCTAFSDGKFYRLYQI